VRPSPGAFEIYDDITARTEEMNRLIERSNRVTVLMAGTLLAAAAIASWRVLRAVRDRDRAEAERQEQPGRRE
jgi:heme A synthase